jgi:hypothetical protein
VYSVRSRLSRRAKLLRGPISGMRPEMPYAMAHARSRTEPRAMASAQHGLLLPTHLCSLLQCGRFRYDVRASQRGTRSKRVMA